MNFIEPAGIREQLFPFTLTRPIQDIRIGILTIREKWERFAPHCKARIPANLIPSLHHFTTAAETVEVSGEDLLLERPWNIFQHNAEAIIRDFHLITKGRSSMPIPVSNRVIGDGEIFIEPGASVECSILNTTSGPIYIGRNAEVMEGCLIRGPFALCEGAVLKMGTKVYGGTTLGPHSVGGGEIKNSVLFGYSNKGHDGYLGDSVIGEWCNLGAGVSNSNLKNNAGNVMVYDMHAGEYISAGQKCGLLMGDYTRAAINTSFNTGTVVGVAANVFGPGLTPRCIQSFSWGFAGEKRYEFDKAVQHIANWKKLKKQILTEDEISILRHIFDNHKQSIA